MIGDQGVEGPYQEACVAATCGTRESAGQSRARAHRQRTADAPRPEEGPPGRDTIPTIPLNHRPAHAIDSPRARAEPTNEARERKPAPNLVNAALDSRPSVSAAEAANSLECMPYDVREIERRRIAEELHDGLGQYLSVASFSLATLSKSIGPRLIPAEHQHLTNLSACIAHALDDLRRIPNDLKPMPLVDTDILSAIAMLCAQFDACREDISVHLQIRAQEEDVPSAIHVPLYRILQEACTNACRHADARHIDVFLDADAEGVILEIDDDGIGFDPTILAETRRAACGSLGLANMRRRATLSNGRFALRTTPAIGTRILVDWPCEAAT